jgi:hypothetical protein
MFNIEEGDHRRFLHFLHKHDCQIPFQPYRRHGDRPEPPSADEFESAVRE